MEIKDYLHYYIGSKIRFDNKIDGILIGITPNLLTDLIVLEEIDNNTPVYKNWCSKDSILVIRSMFDMTNDEAWEFHKLGRRYGSDKDIIVTNTMKMQNHGGGGFTFYFDGHYKDYINGKLSDCLYIKNDPKDMNLNTIQFKWLLSHHFDVFGLIEAGLAIQEL